MYSMAEIRAQHDTSARKCDSSARMRDTLALLLLCNTAYVSW